MPARPRDLASVEGLRVGHAVDSTGRTGVTSVVFDEGAPAVVDVRGGASGTYDTASLGLEATFGLRWSIFVSGGSLFGLDAARGIRSRLLEEGRGVRPFGNPHRIVPISGAVIFDLPRDAGGIPDYATLGYDAAANAGRRAIGRGRVGAGAGASVGKYLGRAAAMAGGLGSAARHLDGGGTVGVLAVVNSVGAVRNPATGRWIAGARGRGGRLVPPSSSGRTHRPGQGTTVAIVATDVPLSRPALARAAAIVHAGIGRAIVPYLTATDGDCVFVATTAGGRRVRSEPWPGASADHVGRVAADAAEEAVVQAVRP